MMHEEHKRLRTLFSCLLFSLGLLTLVGVSQILDAKWVNAEDLLYSCVAETPAGLVAPGAENTANCSVPGDVTISRTSIETELDDGGEVLLNGSVIYSVGISPPSIKHYGANMSLGLSPGASFSLGVRVTNARDEGGQLIGPTHGLVILKIFGTRRASSPAPTPAPAPAPAPAAPAPAPEPAPLPSPPPPAAKTDYATEIGPTWAVLNGTVSTITPDADVWFDFGTSPNVGTRFDIPGAQGTKAMYYVDNLAPGREYFYRVGIEHSGGAARGSVVSFRTLGGDVPPPPPPPVWIQQPKQTQSAPKQTISASTAPSAPSTFRPSAKTLAAADLEKNMATLKSLVLPGGLSTRAWFEYGNSEALGKATGKASVGAGRAWTSFNLRASLPPNEPFYYRVAAENAKGISRGAIVKVSAPGDALFTVEPAAQIVKAGELAQFKATYDPDGIGAKAAEDVTKNAVWLSADVEVAAHEIGGGFRAKGNGEAIVTAVYNPAGSVGNIYDLANIRADAAVSVEGGEAPAGNGRDVFLGGNEAAPVERGEPSAGRLWTGIGIALLALMAVGTGSFFMLRKLRY